MTIRRIGLTALLAASLFAASARPARAETPRDGGARVDLNSMFDGLSRDERTGWAKLFASSKDALTEGLAERAEKFGCKQSVDGNAFLWVADGRLELMLAHVPDPKDLDKIAAIYDDIAKHKPPLTFAMVNQQPDGGSEWDLFRLWPKRYMDHCNRVSAGRKPRAKYEPKRPVRQDIRKMFSHMPSPQVDLAWTEAFFSAPAEGRKHLARIAREYGCTVKAAGTASLWIDGEGKLQAMFVVPDPGKLDDFRQLYRDIKKHEPPITYVMMRARNGMACIFGLWEESYLNHHNQLPKTDLAVRRFLQMERRGAKMRTGRPLPEDIADPRTVMAKGAVDIIETVMKETVDVYGQTDPGAVADLICLRAAGIDTNYETVMTVSGKGITFAYDRKFEFWRPRPAPPGGEARMIQAVGASVEHLDFKSPNEAWKLLTDNIKAGRLVRRGARIYFAYREGKARTDRKTFAIEMPWVKAIGWNNFARDCGKPGSLLRYGKAKGDIGQKATALAVISDMVLWSGTHPQAAHWAYNRSAFGIDGITAYAANIADTSRADTWFSGGWRGGKFIYPLWTGRKCSAEYLKKIAPSLPAEARPHIATAVKELDAAYDAWLEWEKHLGIKGPLRCWSMKEHRKAGAAAVSKAAGHEKKAIDALTKILGDADDDEAF